MSNKEIRYIRDIKELYNFNYINSTPLHMSIIDITTNKLIVTNDKYVYLIKGLIKHIVDEMQTMCNNTLTQREKINITKLNCHTNYNLIKEKGYYHIVGVNLYIQIKDANESMKEIIRLSDRYKYDLHLVIKLQDGMIIKY